MDFIVGLSKISITSCNDMVYRGKSFQENVRIK